MMKKEGKFISSPHNVPFSIVPLSGNSVSVFVFVFLLD